MFANFSKSLRCQAQRLSASLLLSVSLICLSACGAPSDKMNKELKTISSWAATVRMVGESLMGGKLPDTYAKRTIETARQTLQEESATLGKSSDIRAEQRQGAQQQIDRLQQIIAQMKTAIESRDRGALSQLVEQVAVEDQTIKSSSKGDSSQQ
jgi:hypothetical protein